MSVTLRGLVTGLAILLLTTYFVLLIAAFVFDAAVKQFFMEHMGAGVAVPLAELASFLLVSLLEIKSGPVEVTAPGFRLKGAAGEIIFWVICFLAIIASIRLVP